MALDYEYREMVRQYRSSDKESKHKEIDHFVHTMIEDWTRHFRKNLPWIPEMVANKMIRIVSAYQERALAFRKSLIEAPEAKLPEVLADEYSNLKAMKEAIDFDWLRVDVRAALGIEEPDIDRMG